MLGALTDDATQGDFDANRGSRLIRERRMRPLVDPLSILVAEKNRSEAKNSTETGLVKLRQRNKIFSKRG